MHPIYFFGEKNKVLLEGYSHRKAESHGILPVSLPSQILIMDILLAPYFISATAKGSYTLQITEMNDLFTDALELLCG